VALSIFAIFITVAIGGFIQALANQRIVLKLSAATDNMSLTLEQMMREMRVGTNFETGTDDQLIQFDHYDDNGNLEKLQYYLDSSKKALIRKLATTVPEKTTEKAITADNVEVSYFKATTLAGNLPGSGPCRIGMTFGVTASDRGVSITNYIQTTVSSRVFSDTCR
jgi:hypothetical protein